MSWRDPRQQHALVPPLLASCLRRLPPYPGSLLLAKLLNRSVAPQLPDDVRRALAGKRLRLRINDAALTFDLGFDAKGFVALHPNGQFDLAIGSTVHGLYLLARRREDPDSLFFGRRLTLEGDTELGLLFKNTLDALEFPTWELLRRRG